MKKQVNPMFAGIIVAVIVVLLGGYFWYSQSVPDRSTSLIGADGKRHFPRPAGGGGGEKASGGNAN